MFPFYPYSQTFIGPSLGIDLAEIKEEPNDVFFEVFDKGYSVESFYYGLRIEQRLSNTLSLTLQGNCTKKKVNALIYNFVPMKGFEFNYFRSSLSLNWSVLNNWMFGIGPTYHSITNINQLTKNGNIKAPYMDNKNEYGGVFLLGFKYWNFLFELSYRRGINVSSTHDESELLKPINSIGISVNYMIKVFGRKKGKAVYCPKF